MPSSYTVRSDGYKMVIIWPPLWPQGAIPHIVPLRLPSIPASYSIILSSIIIFPIVLALNTVIPPVVRVKGKKKNCSGQARQMHGLVCIMACDQIPTTPSLNDHPPRGGVGGSVTVHFEKASLLLWVKVHWYWEKSNFGPFGPKLMCTKSLFS